MTQVGQVKQIKDYFRNTKKRREFFGGETLVAYDIDQLWTFEAGYAKHSPGRDRSGLPPYNVIITLWQRARDSWERVMLALPPGPDRDEMLEFLRERDAVMERFRERARGYKRLKEVQGHA